MAREPGCPEFGVWFGEGIGREVSALNWSWKQRAGINGSGESQPTLTHLVQEGLIGISPGLVPVSHFSATALAGLTSTVARL